MRQGGDFFGRTRREWLKRALFGSLAMPLLLRGVLAAGKRASGMVDVRGEVLINGVPPFVGSGKEYSY